MTVAPLIAVIAGVLAAVGLVELITGRGPRSPRAGTGARARRSGLRALTVLGRRVSPAAPGDLRERLDAAGLDMAVRDAMALKAGSAAAGLLLAVVAGPGLPGRLWILIPAAPLVGFLALDLWLRRRCRRRRSEMEQQLGDVLELLRVAVDAGLPATRALSEVGRRHRGVLAGELRRAAVLVELGVGHDAATESLLRRCPAHGIATLVAALRRAERHGAPLGDALAAQAVEARARRARASAEVAARAAPKIQLIVALLLVPSAMLLIAAAMVPALSWR